MQERSRHSGQTNFVGKLIQEDREQAGLSLNQYAAAVGVSRTYLSRLEQGIHEHPSPDVLVRIAEGRGLKLADLFLASGYATTTDVPSVPSCVRSRHGDWPDKAFAEFTNFYEYLQHKYGSNRHNH